MADRTSPLWHAAHYNALAKEIRELFPVFPSGVTVPRAEYDVMLAQRGVLSVLALHLAKRFQAEREEIKANGGSCYDFDPIKFLDACSPDVDQYPLSELWEDDDV